MHYTSRDVYEYISTQTNDPIVEWKTCRISGTQFPIYQSDLDFYAQISPTLAGQKFQIPTPTLCPEERQRRRLVFRNERNLYRRTCDASGKNIISIYAPDKPYKVYDQKLRRSDNRNPMDYGREFDFSKTFAEQFNTLLLQVPFMNIMNDNGVNSVNSEYCNNFSYGKNCYMIHTSRHGTDSMYASSCQHIVDTYDGEGLGNTQDCYECVDGNQLQSCFYVSQSTACSNCWFCKQVESCADCLCCSNLVNKQYCILNVQYDKETYKKIMQDFLSSPQKREELLEKYNELLRSLPRCATYGKGCAGAFGDSLFNSAQIVMGFNIYNGKRCKYYFGGSDTPRDSYDITVGGDHDYGYESIVPDFSYNSLFTVYCRKCRDILYSFDCHNSSHIFGCIGLRNKSYCIFNKQYTKEEYESLVAKIITHMHATKERGEFFHPSLSPFGYNETLASGYFPLTRAEALERGYAWQDTNYDPTIPQGAEIVDYRDPARSIGSPNMAQLDLLYRTTGSQESMLKMIFVCEVSGRPFRLMKLELDFYHKHHLPLPRKHPDVRHAERMNLRTPRELHMSHCDQCKKDMVSVYPMHHEGNIYCEDCYKKEVYA